MTSLRALDLFAGIGGFALGLKLAGAVRGLRFRTALFVENAEDKAVALAANFPRIPVHPDIRSLTGKEAARRAGRIDIVTGGFPCQDISGAGRGAGIDGARSGLWREFARVVDELLEEQGGDGPDWVLGENSPFLRTRGADRVCGDLERLGYTCWPTVVRASDVGAGHERARVFIVAHRHGAAVQGRCVERGSARPRVDAQAPEPDPDSAELRLESGRRKRTHGPGAPEPPRPALSDADREGQLQPRGREPSERRRAGDGGGASLPDRGARRQRALRPERARQPVAPQRRWSGDWSAQLAASVYDAQRPFEERRLLDEALSDPARESVWSAGLPRPDADPGRAERGVGRAVHGLPAGLVPAVNAAALRGYGDAVGPPVVALIGRAILTVESDLRAARTEPAR